MSVNGQYGYAGTYNLSISVLGDDHGNDSSAATPIGVATSADGEFELSSDRDWFQFDAVAGESYVFETHLDRTTDSWLELYGVDGQTLLAFDDDGGDGRASRIEWTAPEDGAYFLNVEENFRLPCTSPYTLDVSVSDSSPPVTDLIDLSVRFTDMLGQPIESLQLGQEFRIEVMAADLREGDDWEGVLAAFADVMYDSSLIDVSSIHHVFDDFTFGSLIDGEADDAGGLELESPSASGPQTIFTLNAVARQLGTLQVDTNVAEHLLAENLLFGVDGDLRELTRYGSGSISIRGELSLEIAADEIAENAGAGATTATVSRSDQEDLSRDLVVILTSSDTSEATVPETVVIPAGQRSIVFEIDAVDDDLIDGTLSVTITATSDGYTPGSDTVNVTDFELADLVTTRLDVTDDHLLGGIASIQLEIANTGTGRAASFRADVVLSADDIIGNDDDIVIETLEFPDGLNPGEIVNWEFDTADLRSLLYEHALAQDAPGLGIGHLSGDVIHIGLQVDATGDILESNLSNNTAVDDVTYFPWDTDGNGTVTPADVGYIVNRLGNADPIADLDGNGTVTPTEVVATLNRIGYVRNDSVIEINELPSQVETLTSTLLLDLDAVSSILELEASISTDAVMGLSVELADSSGASVHSLQVGQEFQIRMLADDLREDEHQTSVISAYADLMFDPEMIDISGISHSFGLLPSGTIDTDAGVALGVGGLQVNYGNPADGPQLVAILTAQATSSGRLAVESRSTQVAGLQNTIYLLDTDVRDATQYGSATVLVLQSEFPRFVDGTLTLSMDDVSTSELSVGSSPDGTVAIYLADDLLTTSIAASDVTTLMALGTSSDDVIDLSGVTRAAFPSLAMVNVDGPETT